MMGLTVNQILVICLILVLVGFVAVLGNMGVHAVVLLKELKKLVGSANKAVEDGQEMVKSVGDKIKSTADTLVEESDVTTKTVTLAATGIIGCSLVSGLFKLLVGKKYRKNKKAKRQLKRSEKQLKEAEKAAKKARKIQKKAAKLGKLR